MSVAFVMLVHEALHRAEEVARHLSKHGCPVVIHVDKRVGESVYEPFVQSLADLGGVKFSKRYACEWGTWSLVQATQDASELMLASFPTVQHVYLSSGSCLPLRPISELKIYLQARPKTDFIESVTTQDVPWAVDGLEGERFTLRFPFSWKRQRKLFDRYVRLQRWLKFSRNIPAGLMPHLGSQWWCLSRETLAAILEDPKRKVYDRYFKKSWIPDESYFQTLVRCHGNRIESRSLTLSKFGYGGRPHTFYDDHLQLLRRSDCFVARKIWSKSDRLYDTFLNDKVHPMKGAEPSPEKIDRIFSKAVNLRISGREGLHMQSRHPTHDEQRHRTSAPYSVLEGYSDLFENFEEWFKQASGVNVHGHIFARERANFSRMQDVVTGSLSNHALLRDHNSAGFLANLVWNTRGERQCFMFGPEDNQDVSFSIAADPNAYISVISGAWAVPLFHSSDKFSDIRAEAARLQKIEMKHLNILRSHTAKAKVRIWTVAECIEGGLDPLQSIINEIRPGDMTQFDDVPQMRNLNGFARFLQDLKNQGMHPHLMGDFSVPNALDQALPDQKKMYSAR